jgi:hypothetical protein
MVSGFAHWMMCRNYDQRDAAAVARFKRSIKRNSGKMISTFFIIAFLAWVGVLATDRLPNLIDIGKRDWIAPYLVRIENPYVENDTMFIDLKLNSTNFAARSRKQEKTHTP